MEVYPKEQIDPILDHLLQEVIDLKAKVALIDSISEQWVTTKVAMKITGRSRQSLERARESNLVNYSEVDKTYEVKSLIAYKNKKDRVRSLTPVEIRDALLKQVA